MKWSSAVSERPDTSSALEELIARVGAEVAAPDLAIVFASPAHARFPSLPERMRQAFPAATVIGCTARGVIGGGHEVEEREALSLTCASLPDVKLRPIWFDPRRDADANVAHVQLPPGDAPSFLLLADPFTSEAAGLLRALDAAYPGARIVGGLASGGSRPGSNVLWLGDDTHRQGAVALAMTGNLVIDTLVAQGCRPIGRPMTVTRGEGHLVAELDSRPAVGVLRELFASLSAADQELARHSLFIGLEMNEQSLTFSGDLLVRNLVGIDPAAGAITVAAQVRPWQVVQFLLRDAHTATEDLERHLERYRASGAQPAGALLFSCLGRGLHLFGAADHDTGLFAARLGTVPLGGFFCNGEIGPVGGTTFLHGYTSAFGLFRPR